jgi:hypothetical protein
MNNYFRLVFFFFFMVNFLGGQNLESPKIFPFKEGESLKYKMSYSNFLNAGFSSIDVKEILHEGKEAFHVLGKGKSTGLVRIFFKLKNDYQTFMYKHNLKPFRFIRKINEGGYTKNKEILFNHDEEEATVKNYKNKTTKKYSITKNAQDMLSALYFLRNQDLEKFTPGQELSIHMFYDQEINDFKLRFLGKEVINTKFGKINSLKFRPLVQTGRVFKEQESLTIWISDDENKIPLRIKASLTVGSLRADLNQFRGLVAPLVTLD